VGKDGGGDGRDLSESKLVGHAKDRGDGNLGSSRWLAIEGREE